ncbi:unnamed protein product [Rhizophagus irregularis]|nr:unnamed protein product [Rhizophagus irregularis]
MAPLEAILHILFRNVIDKLSLELYSISKLSLEDDIINEINIMRVASHPSIIQFYGIAKFKDKPYYSLPIIVWYHPNNILIHKNTIKLADFGCSRLRGNEYYTKPCGIIPYMDPKILGTREKPIPNTNIEFVALYEVCWKQEPDERPDIRQVISELNSIEPNNFNSQDTGDEDLCLSSCEVI